MLTQKKEKNLFIKTSNLNKPTFPSFNLSMFSEEDGTAINNEDRK